MDEIVPPQSEVPQPPSTAPVGSSSQSAASIASDIAATSTFICPQCHFPVKPEYYYCPNCGKNLRQAVTVLSTDLLAQFLLYGFSIALPIIFYIAITKWQGIKYIRSSDPKAKQMGYIALFLLVASSVIFFWWSIVQLQGFVQSSVNSSLNNGCGGLC
jgi:hypothetical protein